MTLSELKQVINSIPKQYDDSVVYTVDGGEINKIAINPYKWDKKKQH